MKGQGCNVTYVGWEWVWGGISQRLQIIVLPEEVSGSNKHVGVLRKVWFSDGLQGESVHNITKS